MTNAAALLAQTRRGARLTQAQLGDIAGITQEAISRAEREKQDLTVGVLGRLVHAAGWRLIAVPTQSGTVADAAYGCSKMIEQGNEDGAYRCVIQLADWLAAEHGAGRVVLTFAPPVPTGDARYDAFIAGVVEYRLNQEGLPRPDWITADTVLPHLWFVDEFTAGDQAVIDATPRELRDRGVIIDAVELVSV